MINPKMQVETLFRRATEEENVSIQKPNCFFYFDQSDNYFRFYYYDDTEETIRNRILMDKEVVKLITRICCIIPYAICGS